MVSAIISDSLLFKSPTCTDQDIAAARELAEIAGVDLDSYGLEMLKAGADVSSKSVSELISLDAKEFTMGANKLEIAQVNVVDTNDVFQRKAEVEQALTSVINEKGLDLFLLVVTDILENDSKILAMGKLTDAVEKAYNVTLEENTAILKGVVSRKKQIVPSLDSVLAK
jgi:manganese-dependent inorganic pyrophosphatase